MRNKAIVLLAAALCLGALGTGSVLAKPKAKTTVEIKSLELDPRGEGTYEGKVKSPKGKCKKRRRVTLIHDSKPPFEIGEALTDERGHWRIRGPVPPAGDRIVAKVKKNERCKRARELYEVADLD